MIVGSKTTVAINSNDICTMEYDKEERRLEILTKYKLFIYTEYEEEDFAELVALWNERK